MPQIPPSTPTAPTIRKTQRSIRDIDERAREIKGKPLPKPTDAPPLAELEPDTPTPKVSGTPGVQTAEKKESARADLKSKETAGTQASDESIAAEKLKQAKAYQAQKNFAKAKECCQEIINKYSHTKALMEAALLFNELK
jgi:hypothetical protein